MKKHEYKYGQLRKLLVILGLLSICGYFMIYVIKHWQLIAAFWQSSSKTTLTQFLMQLRTKNLMNITILLFLTALTAAIPFMSNAIFAIFNGLIYGPAIGFLMNLSANILGNFIFVRILKMIDLKDNDIKLKKYFAGFKNVIDAVENQELGIMLGYMIPVIPTLLINYHVAKIKLPWRRWFLYVTIGVAPSSLLYALGGDAVVAGNLRLIIVLLVIFIAISLIGTYFKRKKNKSSL